MIIPVDDYPGGGDIFINTQLSMVLRHLET
jgi:hypothetical protein